MWSLSCSKLHRLVESGVRLLDNHRFYHPTLLQYWKKLRQSWKNSNKIWNASKTAQELVANHAPLTLVWNDSRSSNWEEKIRQRKESDQVIEMAMKWEEAKNYSFQIGFFYSKHWINEGEGEYHKNHSRVFIKFLLLFQRWRQEK